MVAEPTSQSTIVKPPEIDPEKVVDALTRLVQPLLEVEYPETGVATVGLIRQIALAVVLAPHGVAAVGVAQLATAGQATVAPAELRSASTTFEVVTLEPAISRL